MILSDSDIRKYIKNKMIQIKPYNPKNIQNNSYLLEAHDSNMVQPLEHINVWTKEYITMPNTLVGLLTSRSTIARKGLFFATSIGVDAGFKGNLVIELFNVSKNTINISKGEKLVHIWFLQTSSPCKPYKGVYHNQKPRSGLENV